MGLLKGFILFCVFISTLIFLLRDELFKEPAPKIEKVSNVKTPEKTKNIYHVKSSFPDEYFKMKPTDKKQKYFFNFLYPLILNANENILKERSFVESLKNETTLTENSYEYNYLKKLAKKYRVKDIYDYNTLLRRIDIIPPSMALAQAAVESGWGMSRFVKLANNLFGHWTYGEKGIVPLQRDDNATHKIRIFDSIQGSIAAYMLNLNRTNAYKSFRDLREQLRDENKELSGILLSQTMINYSGIKEKYLMILDNMITANNLSSYDDNYFKNLNKGEK